MLVLYIHIKHDLQPDMKELPAKALLKLLLKLLVYTYIKHGFKLDLIEQPEGFEPEGFEPASEASVTHTTQKA